MLKTISKFACAAALIAAVATPASAAGLASFVGTWTNTNPATRGIVKIVITLSGTTLTINPYGACVPTACNWGSQPGVAYAPTVGSNIVTQANAATVVFNPGFATNTLTLVENGTRLDVSDFTRFTDGSGRTNYDTMESFHK